jgi:hypothetical protein
MSGLLTELHRTLTEVSSYVEGFAKLTRFFAGGPLVALRIPTPDERGAKPWLGAACAALAIFGVLMAGQSIAEFTSRGCWGQSTLIRLFCQ